MTVTDMMIENFELTLSDTQLIQNYKDKNVNGISYTNQYYDDGKLKSMTDSMGTIYEYEYFSDGTLSQVHCTSDAVQYRYSYTSEGKKSEETYTFKDGISYTKTYSDDGSIHQVIFRYADGGSYIKDYDAGGGITHYIRSTDGFEYWQEFDANGNVSHYKNNQSIEYWQECDATGNILHYKSGSLEYWQDYDKNNKLTHYKETQTVNAVSTDSEYWIEYSGDNIVLFHYKSGIKKYESWKKFNNSGLLIETHLKSGNVEYYKEHATNGSVTQIHYILNDDTGLIVKFEYWKDFNTKGVLTHYKDSSGFECNYEYDEKGKLTHFSNSDNFEYWNFYNVDGTVKETKIVNDNLN